jgi:integrase
MGKIKAPVSAFAVKQLMKKQGFHAMGGAPGLYLRVDGESVTWVFRYLLAGRRRDMSLGPVFMTTLEQARGQVLELRAKIRQGIDPISERQGVVQTHLAVERKRTQALTFDECAKEYIDAHSVAWKSAKHAAQWTSTLKTYASPIIGGLPVAEVDTALVVKVLSPIWSAKTETATRLRGRIESVLGWATVLGHRHGDNPARWPKHLDNLLANIPKGKRTQHHPALPWQEMGQFMTDLRAQAGIGPRALEFAILTAARSGEVRLATWAEIDLNAALWTIPAKRMKAGKEHRVPLSKEAMTLLASMPRMGDLIFPGMKDGQPLSDMALSATLKRMGRDNVTVHGFRSSFRDWAAESTNFPSEVCEHALAHSLPDKVEAAYRRGDLLEKRILLMQAWASYCYTLPTLASVTPIRGKTAA